MNTLDELRRMAEIILEKNPHDICENEWGGNFKKLLEELSIYQIELEHQNKELERSENLLAEAHEEYVKLFESTPVGYVILDEKRNIIKANHTFANSFISVHGRVHPLEGHYFDEFVTAEFRNAFAVFCKMAHTKNTPIPVELKLMDRHNTSRYVLLSARAYDMEKKTIAVTASDISMQKAMEVQLVKAKQDEANANRQKSNFLTNVSQELRTPLATIVGCKEILFDPEITDSEKLRCCSEMVSSTEALLHFSDRILDISALENGDTSLLCQVVDIQKLCQKITPAFSQSLHRQNGDLTVQATGIPVIWSDPLRLGQIISSVLEYAVGNAEGSKISLLCSYVQRYENYGMLYFTFSGDEIFSSEKDFLRHKNLALEGAAHESVNMFMTKRIVTVLNGQMVWVHPLNVLRIEIPVATPPCGQISNSNHEKSSAGFNGAISKMRTCLLVDDVPMNLKILGTMMKKLGYIPTLASSGGEARNMIDKHHYDIVLTDLWMPDINGEDLAIALRQNPEYDDVPIYAVTADVEYNSNFDMDFFSGTIIKPISLEKLRQTIIINEEERNM